MKETKQLENKSGKDIMTAEGAAQCLGKSLSWVYKNWKELGGRKLGGSLFFPSKEDLYERIFGAGQGMEVRLHPQENQVLGPMVRDRQKGVTRRNKKKGGSRKTDTTDTDPNRHGLLGAGEPTP
jgi:hypothetical protein